jgi:hypothetical protein
MVLASLDWFFSTRPRLFIRVFVPHDELWGAGRRILRDPIGWRRGLRVFAILHLVFGIAVGFLAWWI